MMILCTKSYHNPSKTMERVCFTNFFWQRPPNLLYGILYVPLELCLWQYENRKQALHKTLNYILMGKSTNPKWQSHTKCLDNLDYTSLVGYNFYIHIMFLFPTHKIYQFCFKKNQCKLQERLVKLSLQTSTFLLKRNGLSSFFLIDNFQRHIQTKLIQCLRQGICHPWKYSMEFSYFLGARANKLILLLFFCISLHHKHTDIKTQHTCFLTTLLWQVEMGREG